MSKCKSPIEALACVESGQRIFVHGGAATPNVLLEALTESASRLSDVEIMHLHTEGPCRYAEPEFAKNFKIVNLFVGANLRAKVDADRIDYLPCFLSEIPQLLRSGRRPVDVALLHLSPPDKHGYCSLGVSVDVARAAFQSARIVVAQVNRQMPRVHGDSFIHLDELDAYVEVDVPLYQAPPRVLSAQDQAIGRHVAELVEDGSCLQVGIGSIPDAVLSFLKDRRRLGVHSEMWSDGILRLIEAGAIDNSEKAVHAGKTVSAFIIGSKSVYDHIDDNLAVIQLGTDYVNNPSVIARNPKVVAINSAVAVDLTGQVCADSIGSRIISGVGGQMDFIRGASLSKKGKPVIALPSRTKTGKARIVPTLLPGSGVVTTRAHVHFVVTEYGMVDLYGKSMGE
ncbi:MAG: acetyl-CoA hydrolase/transferase family protein, partial [Calothrix sp. SM1_5_4]|nr:acetyl-CoA hydrolase/transferase family protein [Calothrix sp. SM1_5_4]